MISKLRITWIKSDIGYPSDQKRTIKALGFRKLNQTVELDDRLSLRGMVSKVKHLVKFEVVNNGDK